MFAARSVFMTSPIASVPVQFIAANVGTGGAVTIPTHLVGDIIVMCGLRPFAVQAPTKPSAGGTVPNWVVIDNADNPSGGGVITAQFQATATNTTSGSWSNADYLFAAVLRSQNTTTPVGGHAQTGGSGNAAIAPAVTLAHTDGSSILLHFCCYANIGASGWSAAPAGYTRRATAGTAHNTGAVLNTKDSSTSDGSVSQSSGGSGQNYAGATIEIRN
ncbi:Bacteriophage protein [Mycobacteroides abscessus subsp. abscessus]|nr:Bacteriophage protein [Mycobacteroides abscessus subsp. abscessus]